ncbi:MAG TPA: ABC transporter substrate-binding protein [Thermotogota bacterium]|nr:ABC transporter substrate-binding protein [Thermotogota bacterium]HPJ88125.1 ABC transporter substrate-binding protein [Thermotogota bacterium]
MKKLVILFVLSLVVLSAFAAPAVVDELLTPEQPTLGGTLYLSVASSPQSFNFYGTLDGVAYTIAGNFLNSLVEMHPVTNDLIPGLAESWELSEDSKEVTFHLRDIKWSDGVPFTADDVIFTFENFLLNKFAEGNSIARFTIGGEVVKFVKVDDRTVKAILPTPYGPFFTVLSAASVYPKHILEDQINPEDPGSVNELWTTDTPLDQIVGTGPFVLDQYIVDQKVVLKKNPYYWKEDRWGNKLPYFDYLEYLVVKDNQVRSAKFQAGEIDYMSISASDYPVLKQKELDGASYIIYRAQPTRPTPSPLHLAFNFDAKNPELAEIFSNKDFRAAMEYALDRERIIEEVYNTLAVIGGVPVLPANKAFYNPEIENIRRSYNPEKAEELLDAIGLVDRNGDGWRDFESGNTVEFVLITSTSQEHQDAAYIFSEEAKAVGIKCELQIIDSSLRSQKALSGDYEACLWAFGNQPDPQLRKAIWSPGYSLYYSHFATMDPETKEPYKDLRNMTDWEVKVHDAFEKGETAMDPEVRKEQYGIWQAIYAEYVPFIYICKGMDLMGVSDTLGNFTQTADGSLSYAPYTLFRK